MNSIKILLINDHYTGGGAETVVNTQYKHFKDLYHIDLLIGEDNVKRNSFSYIYSKQAEKLVYNTIKNGRYNIVHLHNYYHFFSPSILKAILKIKKEGIKIKVIYTAHDFHLVSPSTGFYYFKNKMLKPFSLNSGLRDFILKDIDKRGVVYNLLKKSQWINAYYFHKYYRAIDHITTPSHFLKYVISKRYNIKIEVIRNPVEMPEINFSNIGNIANQKNILKLVYWGRLSIEKGLHEFITLLNNITDIDFTFTIYGSGPEEKSLKDWVSINDLKSKVFFEGSLNRNDLLPKLIAYDVFVLPSLWYENAPMSIVEASKLKLKILTHKIGGMYELTEAVGGGYYFEPNVISLNTCFKQIKADIDKNKHPMSKESEDFSLDTFLNKIINLYMQQST